MKNIAEMALNEYNSSETTAHHGGKDGRPFWNFNSTQFTFVPAFPFPKNSKAKKYLFTAKHENGKDFSFIADKPTELLTPIWKDIPPGVVTLYVDALDGDNNVLFPIGLRTFYKCYPFLGRDAYPPKKREYLDCAKMAFKFVFEEPFVKYWLKHGKPDPTYVYNVYPSKTNASIINALITYASISDDDAKTAIKMAKIIADYLIDISYKSGAYKGLPPTYDKDCYIEQNNGINHTASKCDGQIMLIYPALVMISYLNVYDVTKDEKYLNSAKEIADFYVRTITKEGSWPLAVSVITQKPITKNLCLPAKIGKALNRIYGVTKNKAYYNCYKKAFKYIENNRLKDYNWEGQFEDSAISNNYENLTHIDADAYVEYISNKNRYTKKDVEDVSDLIRFIEDQFIVWGKHSPFSKYNTTNWQYPACLEQYFWYLPIDGSASAIITALCSSYKVTKNPLLLEKAYALADMITRVQNDKTGAIPTYWRSPNCSEEFKDFWINCHIGTANTLVMFDKFTKSL